MTDGWSLTLPEPPSANRWWRVVNGRMVTSKAARQYKELVAMLGNGRLVTGPVSVTITWYRSRRSGDLDKRQGVLLDSLQGIAFQNDSQIVELHAYRRDDPSHPRVEVTIRPLVASEAAQDTLDTIHVLLRRTQ